jgi:beta-lactamase regulating signal transducer with metallopeptidase domain
MGIRLDVLAFAGALLLAVMIARGWRIVKATSRAQRAWRANSKKIHLQGIDLPIYRVTDGSSLLAVTGIFRPKIFLSDEIAAALSPQELHAALTHEMAHVAALDNLKQMLLKITRPPRWLKAFYNVDAEWSGAAEIAADSRTLARGASVVDLSSALIKVGRLSRGPATAGVIASHLIPPACNSSLEQRIVRLSELLQSNQATTVRTGQSGMLIFAVFLGITGYVACFHALLPVVHEALELLVR